MEQYRFYVTDAAGKIRSGTWLAAEDDQGAIRQAQALCGAGVHAVEVCLGAKRVAVVGCDLVDGVGKPH